MERIHNQPAFILHKRAYRNTSAILEFFTRDYGRISLVAKGVSGSKSRLKGIMQAFQPLQISWSRKSELGNMTSAETTQSPFALVDEALYAAMYVNEILFKLITKDDPHPNIFDQYTQLLADLVIPSNLQISLRLFEKKLLQDLGYEIDFFWEAETSEAIDSHCIYEFIPGHGFIKCIGSEKERIQFSGNLLQEIANGNLQNEQTLKVAKRIFQLSIKQLLGNTELSTRELYRAFLSTKKN